MPATPIGKLGRQWSEGNREYFVTWGARDVLALGASGEGGQPSKETEQLIYIANEVPETFSITFVARVLEGASGLGANGLVVQYTLTFGVGKNRQVIPYFFVFDPTLAAPVEAYDSIRTPRAYAYKTLEFPVQQMNVVATATAQSAAAATTTEVSATAAPRFKAHYLRETPDYIGEGQAR